MSAQKGGDRGENGTAVPVGGRGESTRFSRDSDLHFSAQINVSGLGMYCVMRNANPKPEVHHSDFVIDSDFGLRVSGFAGCYFVNPISVSRIFARRSKSLGALLKWTRNDVVPPSRASNVASPSAAVSGLTTRTSW